MALVSPGVQVSIVDQSQYLPASPSSVPLIVLATAQNKANAAGTGIAVATTAANANKMYRVTSQRDLVTLYGNPFFYKTTNGTSLQGYELNEYGLLAAYSVLGTTNLCYVLRADIDLASLVGRTGRPSGAPGDGTYWMNTGTSSFGIFEFNASTGNFTVKSPIIVNDSADLTGSGEPLAYIGNIGDYAVTFVTDSNNFTVAEQPDTYFTYWFKNQSNSWVSVGSTAWRDSWPTIQGGNAPVSLVAGNSFDINGTTITVPVSPNNTVNGVRNAINSAAIPNITAANVDGKLVIYCDSVTTELGTIVGGTGYVNGTYNGVTLTLSSGVAPSVYPTANVVVSGNAVTSVTLVTPGVGVVPGTVFTVAASSVGGSGSGFTVPVIQTSIVIDNSSGPVLSALYLDIAEKTYWAPDVFYGNNAQQPLWRSTDADPHPTGSVWIKTNSPNLGTSLRLSQYSSATATYTSVSCPMGLNDWAVTNSLDSAGGLNIPIGTLYAQYSFGGESVDAPLQLFRRSDTGETVVVGENTTPSFAATTFDVYVSTPGSAVLDGPYEVSLSAADDATDFVTAWSAAAIPNTTAEVASSGAIALTHTTGGVIILDDNGSVSSAVTEAGFVIGATIGDCTPGCKWGPAITTPGTYTVQLSNWIPLSYVPNSISPTVYPETGTNWYYSVATQVDIMTNKGGVWKGYRNVAYGNNGLPIASGSVSDTDPSGPIFSASSPDAATGQSDGTPLEYGDLWINTSPSGLENYPVISRWQDVNGINQWVLIDNTNQTTETGILFADARWGSSGSIDPVYDAIPSIGSLLTSNYLDLDAPDAALYPQGTLLFNTRRSGYNVKQFVLNYFNATSFPDETLPSETSAWVSVSGNNANGSPYMGRQAQRAMVVNALRVALDTNTQVREEDTFFNLLACPNYPELQPNMILLNNDRNETAYIVGDTPMRLADNATAITDWSINANNATSTGEQGLVTRNTYMGLYYPSGITTDLTGSEVAVPSSHMILRTMIYNDTVAYPWFAPAGQRRGTVDNVTNIGYLDATTGEFVVTKNRQELRDVEYNQFINPIAYFTNVGILNYGNKNSFDSQSALDRTNVARLICYLRWNLQRALRPFIFEPNDNITRAQARSVVQTLLADIQTKRGVYDYLVVCDETNNTPARIDRNELWVDVAIEPVKAAEFIYVPVRILNTGEIAGLAQNG